MSEVVVGGQARQDGSRAAIAGALLGALALGVVLGPPTAISAPGEAAADTPAGEHLALKLLDGRLFATSGEESEEIVDVTAYCNSCHGEGAAGAEDETAAHPEESAAPDHPVEVAYPEADPGYRDADELAPDLLLIEGRLTCITCHAHDDQRHAPVLTTENSEICRSCHLM